MKKTAMIEKERIIILTVGMVMLMEFMDISILNTSFPQIAFSLNINPINLKVALTVYLLALGAFLPAAGYLAERYGAKPVLICSMTGFMLSSIVCGLSINLLMLTLARAAQGIFGAFVTPVARIIVMKLFKDRLGEAMARIVPIFLLGPLLGPLIGGAITTFLHWRFIFFVNIPIGLTALVIINRCFPTIEPTFKGKFDLKGFLLMATCLITMLFALDTLTAVMIPGVLKILSVLISVLLLIAYIIHARSSKEPIIDLTVFSERTYRYYTFMMAAFRLFAMGMGFLGSLYVQTQYHYSALMAGLIIAPMVLGSLASKYSVKWFMTRFSPRQGLVMIFITSIAVQLAFAYIMLHFNIYAYLLVIFVNGWCAGYFMPIAAQNIYSKLDKREASHAVIINSVFVQLSQGFAIAFMVFILIVSSGQHQLEWNAVLPKLSYAIVMWISAAGIFIMTCLLVWVPSTSKE